MAAALALSVSLSTAAYAETYVYVHGWLPAGDDLSSENNGTYSRYAWGKPTLPGTVFVGWNTGNDWRGGAANAVATLDARCSRSNPAASCTIICHSMGCAVTGLTLDAYGTTSGTPRWRINRVLALGSGEGGSELGNLGSTNDAIAFFGRVWGFDTQIVTSSLRYTAPGVVRPAYDHNDTAGTPWFHVAGYNGDFWSSALLPGQDDGVVAFHSACGYVKVFSSTDCSNDWEWVRKTSFGVPYYVQRTVARWTNHSRVNYCGRDGCNHTHMFLTNREFQDLATVPSP
jgi:hypothetical protein